jgi:PPP family 3-phenylpropionic acid transporter
MTHPDGVGAASLAVRLRFFYFVHYIAIGIYYPFLVPHLRAMGLGGSEIGIAQMAGSLAAVPASFLWGTLADRLRAPARVLELATAAAFAASVGLIFARTPLAVALLLFLRGLAAPAIVPLIDTIAVDSLHARPGASYARLRVFGSIGFVVSAQSAGLFLAQIQEANRAYVMPIAYAAAVLGTTLAARTLKRHARRPAPAAEPRPKPHLSDVRALVTDRRIVLFLLAGAVHEATTASYQLYGALVHDRGLSPVVTGAGMAFGVIAEVLVLFAFPALERRFSVATLLGCAFAGSALRWWLTAHAAPGPWIIAIQGFHGLTFGLYWAAAVKGMSLWIPARLRATGQALYSGITTSLGGAIGYRLAGAGYERWGGAEPVYGVASAVELVAIALALRLRSHEPERARVLKEGTR